MHPLHASLQDLTTTPALSAYQPSEACLLQVDDLVVAMEASLQAGASQIASQLRRQGRCVDLVLEPKRMKWVFKVRVLLRQHLC